MGIIEAIQEEIKRISYLEGEEKGLEKGQISAIHKMYKKGFSVEVIADVLEIPTHDVANAIKQK
jgi:predicted transposase YdaD